MSTQIEFKKICNSILNTDDSIRFVGLISEGGKLLESTRRQNLHRFLTAEEEDLSFIQAAMKSKMSKLWDDKLGKTKWTIDLKEKVKLITIFLDSEYLVLSTETTADHQKIIAKIQDVLLA